MERRSLLKSLPALLAIPAFGFKPAEAATKPSPSWRTNIAKQIINESGEMWLAARERYLGLNPILVAFDDDRCVEIRRASNRWDLTERVLTTDEATGRDKCREHYSPAFGAQPRIGQVCSEKPYWLRAWIKNGRSPGWLMSIGGFRSTDKPL